MGKSRGERRRQERARRDAEYRAVLKIGEGETLPARIGTGGSASGGQEGGKDGNPRSAAALRQTPAKAPYGVNKRPAAELKLTAEQVRTVQCPRCLAKVGRPCRNSRGKAYWRGHADRQRRAFDAGQRERGGKTGQIGGPARVEVRGAGADPMQAVFAARRRNVVDNGDGVLRQVPGGNRMA